MIVMIRPFKGKDSWAKVTSSVVLNITQGEDKGEWWWLHLDCGHNELKPYRKNKPVLKKVRCSRCKANREMCFGKDS